MPDERLPCSDLFVEFLPRSSRFEGTVPVSPSRRERAWFQPGFYHCLPLQLANQIGWMVHAPEDFSVFWTGHDGTESLTVRGPSPAIVSHFGHGIFTFKPPFLFRTNPGVDLLVKAVPNLPKDGVCVLEGLVETDNFRGQFTFNFKLTRPDCWVTYTKGEPLAQIVPYPRGWLERFEARTLSEGPEYDKLIASAEAFSHARVVALTSNATPLEQRDWHYFKGRHVDDTPYAEHTKQLNIGAFPAVARSTSVLGPEPESKAVGHTQTTVNKPSTSDEHPETRCRTVPDFFPDAQALRDAFVRHCANPNEHHPQTHQIWNYWHAPPLYTYLRTSPDKVFAKDSVDAFVRFLTRWAIKTLGLSNVTQPYLALYINGCRQGLHNDANNGRFAYVFSLTDWEQRQFSGGETIIFPEEPYWTSPKRVTASAGRRLYDMIPPRFNQLLIFDDQLIHGVEAVSGTSDPTKGRLVMSGHLREGGLVIDGPLAQSSVAEAIGAARPLLDVAFRERLGELRGLLTIRVDIADSGRVSHIESLVNTVELATGSGLQADRQLLLQTVRDGFSTLQFPTASHVTSLYVPLRFQKSPVGW